MTEERMRQLTEEMMQMPDPKRLGEHHGITWDQLVELEPRLNNVLSDVKCARYEVEQDAEFIPPNELCFSYEAAWNRCKVPIGDLVGCFRHDDCDPRLKTRGAYEVAYYTLWHALFD